jgi:hypothetical protein
MSDSHTVTTSQSWFQRMGSSLSGFLVGIVLFFGSFFLLTWNEGRAVKQYNTLKEGEKAVVSVRADAVDPKHEGRLVHVTEVATTSETLEDPEFKVTEVALRLRRTVEMFQWKESSHKTTKEKLGGGTETTTTYKYEKVWSARAIRSAEFNRPAGHENPASFPYESIDLDAKEARLGMFLFPQELVRKIDVWEPVPLTQEIISRLAVPETSAASPAKPAPAPPIMRIPGMTPPAPADAALPKGASEAASLVGGRKATVRDGILLLGDNPDQPAIGDVRVKLEKVPPTQVSVVARQTGNVLTSYPAKSGNSIYLLQKGIASAPEMFATARAANKLLTWVLRLVGFVVMVLGLNLMAAPLATLGSVIPFIGRLLGFATGVVALFVAGALSTATIGIAWLAYRPFLAIPLLAVAVLALGFGFDIWRRHKPATSGAK